jgi:hypothetical protein
MPIMDPTLALSAIYRTDVGARGVKLPAIDWGGSRYNVLADVDVHPDGSSASGEGLQRVLDTAGLAGGGCVEIPHGTYVLDRQLNIPSNVTVAGVGYGSRLLLAPQATGVGVLHMLTNADHTDGNSNITIRGLRLDGSRSSQSATDAAHTGIWLENVNGAVVAECFVEDIYAADYTYGAGIMCAGGRDVILTSNVVRRAKRLGIGTSAGPYGVTINGNTTRDCGEEGIHCSTGVGVTVTGNTCEGNAWQGINMTNSIRSVCTGNSCNLNGNDGILSLGGECAITGNSCSANGRYGILLQSAHTDGTTFDRVVARVAVTGNYVTDNAQHALVAERVAALVISGNVFGVPYDGDAIHIAAPLQAQQTVTGETYPPRGISIVGNVATGEVTRFVSIAAGYDYIMIANNIHAGTILVSGPPAHYTNVNNMQLP